APPRVQRDRQIGQMEFVVLAGHCRQVIGCRKAALRTRRPARARLRRGDEYRRSPPRDRADLGPGVPALGDHRGHVRWGRSARRRRRSSGVAAALRRASGRWSLRAGPLGRDLDAWQAFHRELASCRAYDWAIWATMAFRDVEADL